jgi:serine/threonine protein kinase/WD40 repeat protein
MLSATCSTLVSDSPPSLEEALFDLAVQKPDAAERAAFLDSVCQGNPGLRSRLEQLLKGHFADDDFLTNSPKRPEAVPVPEPSEARLPPDARERMIGRYRLLERIGEGGFGEVWMAEQREPVKRRVALKIIKAGMVSDQAVARFEAERQALALMDHPNIARVFDGGTTEIGRPYFVMELVRGSKLTDYCDKNQLPMRERLELFIKVCQAIQHAHQKGIIHRDIKPSNILVTLHDGVPVPKVIDFGIAKATQQELTDKTLFTQFQQFIGTPAYISPEQAETSGLDIDTRSDIYSLGVLLYELLVGRTPFDPAEMVKGGLDALRRVICEKEPVKPSTKLRTLPAGDLTTTAQRRQTEAVKLTHQLRGDLDWIILKCLEKDRNRRYETANGLAADIQRHLAHEPIAARPPSTAYRIQKAWQRNKVVCTSAAMVAVALVAGTGVSIWQAVRATQAQRSSAQSQAFAEAEQERANDQARKASASEQQSRRLLYVADMNLAHQALKLNNLGKARRLLDRHRPAPGTEDLRGWEWRYLWQLTRGTPHVTLINRPVIGASVSLSPDGSFLAAGWRGGQVDLWNVPGRRLIRTLREPDGSGSGRAAFSPVRNLLAAVDQSDSVTLHDLDSGQESSLWQAPADFPCAVRDLAFSPDGSRLVIYGVSSLEQGGRVWVVEIASRRIEGDYRTASNLQNPHFDAARLSRDNRRVVLTNCDGWGKHLTLQCFELATGQKLWETEPLQDGGLTALALSHDGRTVASATGYDDTTIQIWDASDGRLVRRLHGHTGWVSNLVFTQAGNGERLISSSADQTIRSWDTRTWNETKVWRGHTDEVQALAVAAADPRIASAGKDGNLMVWTEDSEHEPEGQRHLPADYEGRPMPLDQSRFLLLPPGQPTRVIDLRKDSPPETVPGLEDSDDVLAWANGFICHWKSPSQLLVSEWRGREFKTTGAITLDSTVRPLAADIHPARQMVAWAEAAAPDSIFVARLAAPGPWTKLTADVAGMIPVAFSDEGDYLMARNRGSLRVWHIETGRIVASVDGPIRDQCFAGGGQVLAVALQPDHDHEVQFHDLRQPGRVRSVPGRHYPSSLAASPDGGLVVLSTRGNQLLLFDAVRGEAIEPPLQGAAQGNSGLTFSADGRRMISLAARLETLKVWDVATRQELLSLPGSGGGLQYADWSADGNVILGGPEWQVWRAPSLEEIAAAEAKNP